MCFVQQHYTLTREFIESWVIKPYVYCRLLTIRLYVYTISYNIEEINLPSYAAVMYQVTAQTLVGVHC